MAIYYIDNINGKATNSGKFIRALASFSCSPVGGKNAVSCMADFCSMERRWIL